MPSLTDAILQRIQTRADCGRCAAHRIVSNDVTASRIMESFENPADSVAPYRLPSRHPSADGSDRDADALRGNANAGSAAATKLPTFATDNASDIKRRQEALLIAYLVDRLAR
jgi:hypothetical protein